MSKVYKIEGAQAFDDGFPRNACPYEVGTLPRQDWVDGWAQRRAVLEKVDELPSFGGETLPILSTTPPLLDHGEP